MPLTALLLLLAAAAMHAGWNLLVKRAREKQVFTWWALMVGSLCFAPLLAFGRPLPAQVWPYAIASGLVEAAYYFVLTRAYSRGDFSVVYPLARGAAPALLAVWAALFLGEQPNLAGGAGLALLLLGLLVVGGGLQWLRPGAAGLRTDGAGAALGVACCISIYSAIDGAAVRFADPVSYTVLIVGLAGLFVTPVVLARYGRETMLAEWRANRWRIVLVGVLNLFAYMLVLQAYALARVSYAGAIREISVVFAALVGWRWLGEKFGALRTSGAVLIFSGILVIAVAG